MKRAVFQNIRKPKHFQSPKFGIKDSQTVLDKQKGKGCLVVVLSTVRVFFFFLFVKLKSMTISDKSRDKDRFYKRQENAKYLSKSKEIIIIG